jgi:hypothetical protein
VKTRCRFWSLTIAGLLKHGNFIPRYRWFG